MRDHDTGGWRIAHTIGLIQQAKAAHCVEEMWAIAEMNSDWKVWMASLFESKYAERQIILWSRLFLVVLVGFLHERELSAATFLVFSLLFCHGRMESSLFVYITHCQNEPFPLIRFHCHPAGSADAKFPWQQTHEMHPAARLYSVSLLHLPPFRQPGAAYKSIQAGTDMHFLHA